MSSKAQRAAADKRNQPPFKTTLGAGFAVVNKTPAPPPLPKKTKGKSKR